MIYRYINIKNNVSKRSDLVCLIKHVIVLLRENDSGWHSSAVKIQRHKKKINVSNEKLFYKYPEHVSKHFNLICLIEHTIIWLHEDGSN